MSIYWRVTMYNTPCLFHSMTFTSEARILIWPGCLSDTIVSKALKISFA